ncbi:MAG: J domain-containing protein [Bacteroidetes bacterium]|nr:J domain-containing protein [Bacteroidota bacterium]
MDLLNYYELEKKYRLAQKYYDQSKYNEAYTIAGEIRNEIMQGLDKVKLSRNIAKGAGWLAAFLTGGFGAEDLLIVPAINKVVLSLFGVNLDGLMDLLGRATYMKLICSTLEPGIMARVPQKDMLRDFLILYKLSNSRQDDSWLKSVFRLINPFADEGLNGNEHHYDIPKLLHELYLEASKLSMETEPYGDLLLIYLHAFGYRTQNLYHFLLIGREHLVRDFDNASASGSSRYSRGGSGGSSYTSSTGTGGKYIDPMDKYYGDILGLNGDYSKENIKKKYRERMKESHPDSKAGSNAQEGKRAEEASKRINSAYAYFKKRYNFK